MYVKLSDAYPLATAGLCTPNIQIIILNQSYFFVTLFKTLLTNFLKAIPTVHTSAITDKAITNIFRILIIKVPL